MLLAQVDEQLAEHGVCWMCKQPFEVDGLYYEIDEGQIDGHTDVCSATCLGCAFTLALAAKPPPPPS